MRNTNTVARNAAWLIAQPILVGVISIVVTALVARDLGTAQYGTLLLILSYATLFSQISILGLRPYSVREIAADHNRATEIVSEMLVLRTLLAILAMVVAVSFLVIVEPSLSRPMIFALLALILLGALTGCFIDGLQGGEHMREVATSFAVSGVLTQLGCIAALGLRLGLLGIVSAYMLGAVLLMAMLWYHFNRLVGSLNTRGPGAHLLVHLRKSWAFLLQNVVGSIRGRLDLIVINSVLGASAAGIYGSAMVLIQRLDLIQDGLATALFSRVAYLHAKSSQDLQVLVRGAIKVVLVISTPMAVGLLAVSSDVIALMFGRQYVESGAILAILSIAIPFTFTGGVMFNVMRAMELETVVLRATILATVTTVGFLFGGISLFGVPGAAMAFVAGAFTLAALLVLEYTRRIALPWIGRDLWRIVGANAAMAISLWGVRDLQLALKVAVGVVVYATTARLLGLVTLEMVKAMFAPRKPAE